MEILSAYRRRRLNPQTQRGLALALTAFIFGVLLQPALGAEATKEYQLKAAFLYNFAKFVEWPSDAFPKSDSPIIIGIVGGNPFGADLEKTIKDRTINGHPIKICLISERETNFVAQVLFIAAAEDRLVDNVLRCAANRPVLTVGESDKFIQRGGLINFVFEADKVRFEINAEAAGRAGLHISANLQKLAKKVPGK